MRLSRPTLFALTALAVAGGCNKTTPGVSGKVTGSGSTFIEPVMKVWADEYDHVTESKVRVNYAGTGSGAGVNAMTVRTADFGCTDAPMNRELTDLAKADGGAVAHLPLVIGAVVPVYNVPGLDKPLVFDGKLLADLFTGKVKNWNDPRVAELNPGVKLPALAVQPVYRSDTSGTSFIFADFLGKVSPEFKAKVGVSTKPKWPDGVGIAQAKTDGVAGYVQRTAGAVGYVELTYALSTNQPFGAVQNREGKAVVASLAAITAAADAVDPKEGSAEPPYSLHELTYDLTNAPGAASYPIAGMTFAVIYEQVPAEAAPTVEFLKWTLSQPAQELAAKSNFAPLPEGLRAKCLARLNAVRVGAGQ